MHFIKYPYLQLPVPGGMTILWETDVRATSQVQVWRAAYPACGNIVYTPAGDGQIFTGVEGTMHRVALSGLQLATDYCYAVLSQAGDDRAESKTGFFRTAPAAGQPFSFAVTSETGGAGSPARVTDLLADAMAAEAPDFLLFAGDMVRDGNRAQDWDEHLFTPMRRLIGHTPFYHCAGNHEEHSPLMRDLLATPPQGYYRFAYGCADFFALDSTLLADHIEAADGGYTIECTQPLDASNEQVRFLESALAQSTAPWKFVYLHYPPYFGGAWEARCLRPLCALFEAYGVDIVFTSHAIVYERSHPIRKNAIDNRHGVRYLVVGGAGARPDWFHHKKAWHTARRRAVPHFVHLSVTPARLEMQAIDLDGQLFDTLMLEK